MQISCILFHSWIIKLESNLFAISYNPHFYTLHLNRRFPFTMNFFLRNMNNCLGGRCVFFSLIVSFTIRVMSAHIVTDLRFIIVDIRLTLTFIEFDSKTAARWAVTVVKSEPTKKDSASPRIFTAWLERTWGLLSARGHLHMNAA